MKILIVDDKEEERYLLETLLKGSGYEVVTAVNGAEALEKLRTEGFDMIVSDILMPVMDGFQLCKECKEDEKLRDIPFVFHTAEYAEEEDENLASKLGADRFIRKPIEPDKFIKLIQGVFRDLEEAKKKPVTVGMKILVVEDNEDSRNLLVKQLRTYGHEVMAAADGAEALQQALVQPPDIIASDILMPKMDGYQLCNECKQNDKLKDIPFVFYTATYTREEDEKFALSLGADAFIVKPTEPEVLIQILNEVVEKAKAGALAPPEVTPFEPSLFLIEHEKRIFAKLEDKVAQLEAEITERRRTEEALQIAEQNFRNSLDSSPLGIRIVTAEGELLYANQAILDIYGYSSVKELKATPTKVRYTPESYAEHQERKEKRKLGKRAPPNYEISIVRKDGEIRHLVVSRKEVMWGGETQFQAIYQDITERKRAEDEMRIKDNAIASSINAIAIADLEGNVTYVNHAFLGMWGYDDEKEVLGKNASEFWQVAEEAVEVMQVAMDRGGWIGELVAKRKDGSNFDVQLAASVVRDEAGKPICRFASFVDITERKKAEEEIKRAAEEWRTTFDSITDSVFICDKDFRLVRVNKAFADIVKTKPEELIGKPCYEIVHGTSEPVANCPYKKTIKTKKPATVDFFEPHLGMHLELSTSPIFNEQGEVVASVHVARDITGRKRAEEELKQSEENLRTYLESAPDGIYINDLEGTFLYGNKKAEEIIGYGREELIGNTFLELNILPREYLEKAGELLELNTMGIPTGPDEFELTRKDGSRISVEISTTPIKQGEEIVVIGLVRDITERKKMEEQLIVTDRLASIGELSSGIAHELNNPLTSVIGFSELLLDKDVSDDVKEDLRVINREARRTAEVVKNLLTFARKHPQEKESVNINSIIEKVLELRAYEQKVNNIEVNTQFAPDLPEIIANSFDLQQVFLNIIINAEHFMSEAHGRGTLTITTERVGDIIKASFADNGPGIAEENLGHVFDPFFTTKEVGKGTGLGLSICHGIITEHGGRIYAESEPGKGATFVMELPISK